MTRSTPGLGIRRKVCSLSVASMRTETPIETASAYDPNIDVRHYRKHSRQQKSKIKKNEMMMMMMMTMIMMMMMMMMIMILMMIRR